MVFFISLIIFNFCFVFALRPVANHLDLIDHPGGRKTHPHPTPLIGGLAIYFTLLAAVAIQNDWNSDIGIIISWAGAIVIIGCLDDIKNVRWPIRLCVQVIAAWGVVFTTGIKVTYLGTYPLIGPVELGPISTAFTIFAVIGLTNSFNILDGKDGICIILTSLPLSIIMLKSQQLTGGVNFYYLVLFVSLMVTLFFNLNKNKKIKVFLGDCGSTFLGFLISFIIIISIRDENLYLNPPLALWIVLIPVYNTFFVMMKRYKNRENIFAPTQVHIHDYLSKFTYSSVTSFVIISLISASAIILGLLLNDTSHLTSILVFLVCFSLYRNIIEFSDK